MLEIRKTSASILRWQLIFFHGGLRCVNFFHLPLIRLQFSWHFGAAFSSLLITRPPRHLDTPLETEKRGMGVQNPLQKHLPARFHGKGWWLVPAFFVSTRWRAPDIKIRFVSTAISEATSPIFFPACGCRGDFSFCGIAMGLNYGCLLSIRQIVIVPSIP